MKIPLTQDKFTIVDDEDYERISQQPWHYSNGYAKRSLYLGGGRGNPIRKNLWLHKFIMNAPDNMEVDHINGDTLDNRKANLKICTHLENMQNYHKPKTNTSGYKNVYWQPQVKKWQVKAIRNKINKSYGLYDSLDEAAKVAKGI